MSYCDIFCEKILNPFIKKMIEIKINLSKNIINNDEIKKIEYIINLYNEMTSTKLINKKSNTLENVEMIDLSDDSDIKTNDDDGKVFNEKVLNMIKKSKIIFDFYEKNTIISIKSNTFNYNTSSESDNDSMDDDNISDNDSMDDDNNISDNDDTNDVNITTTSTILC
jgi:hypothetical protein